MKIQAHDDAFKPKMLRDTEHDGEQQDGNKWHVEYDLDWEKVPLTRGSYANVQGINMIEFESDDPNAPPLTGKIWFRADLLHKIFGACKVCYAHTALCLGHEERKPRAEGKRPAAQEANEAAQKRIAKKAAAAGRFAF